MSQTQTSDAAREERWRGFMTAAQSGDAVAYEKLLVELLPQMRGFVRRRVFDVASQEDVVQNVFLSLHRARHTYRPERAFTPWLYAVARNAVVDHLRARQRRQAREVGLAAGSFHEPTVPAVEPDEAVLSPELVAGLAALPPAQREAVVLIHLEELSVSEAAARVGVSKSALKVRAHRGYRALRSLLEGAADE
jgi:RNA polymerase sigma-70 factor (ECF subfamily)